MSTNIDNILDNKNTEYPLLLNEKTELSYQEIILDMSRSQEERMYALEQYNNIHKDNTIEIIVTLSTIYHISKSKIIEDFFEEICYNNNISSILKVESAKSIIDCKEQESSIEEDNIEIIKRNNIRKEKGYKFLDNICCSIADLPSPCRVEAIFLLMNNLLYKDNVIQYLAELVIDSNIEVEYRYKTILSIEDIASKNIKQKIIRLFSDKDLVNFVYTELKNVFSERFPTIKKPDINNLKIWRYFIFELSYDNMRKILNEYLKEECEEDIFIKETQLTFTHTENIPTYLRILSSQYILQKCKCNIQEIKNIENILYSFCLDVELDYNLRADSADVLLRLGCEEMKRKGREIINLLGYNNTTDRTIFDNKQNVHSEKVEESVSEALEFLNTIPLLNVNETPINYEYVNNKIEEKLKTIKDTFKTENDGDNKCEYCGTMKSLFILNKENLKFASEKCMNQYEKDKKIKLALNRIYMDRALYSKFNSSLINILLKIWTYLSNSEHKEEMELRLLEELEEMSGTCSSGYATRLINVISGFGDFNIRISWEDQIVSNFVGRLNSAARNITKDNIYREEKLKDIIEIFLRKEENTELLNEIENNIDKPNVSFNDCILKYIDDITEENINELIQDFTETVINEIILTNEGYINRQSFSLFFNNNVSKIRQEMYEEFKNYISDTDYDLYFRKALMTYEIG